MVQAIVAEVDVMLLITGFAGMSTRVVTERISDAFVSPPLIMAFTVKSDVEPGVRPEIASVEAIVGSAGDDTITAPATVAATGVAQTTINSGDSIDGGAGTDTLTLTITGANNNSLTVTTQALGCDQ